MTDNRLPPIDDVDWDGSPGDGLTDQSLAAAAYELAMLSDDGGRTTRVEPTPAGLAEALVRGAASHVSATASTARGAADGRVRPGGSAPEARRLWWDRVVPFMGWSVAAVLGLLLVSRSTPGPRDPGPRVPDAAAVRPTMPASAEQRRERLLAEDPDTLTVAWSAGEDRSVGGLPPGMTHGDVVWSQSRQQGFMRLRGLAANDPIVEQYQLWIFDADRDAAHPVDGGVFDVAASSADGELCIPIDARLPIGKPTLFAITVEKPGGVVVSTRERLPLLAKVP